MIKLFLLSKVLASFLQITELEAIAPTLQSGERAWVSGKLSDSYENEILSSLGISAHSRSMEEYRQLFWEMGLELEHLEIKREMALFKGIGELRAWIEGQVESELVAGQVLTAMEERGWVEAGDGQIGFPTKRLVACVLKR